MTDFSNVSSIKILNSEWESLGYGVYRNKKTGLYKSERLEAEMPKGFRVVGEIQTDDLTGEVKKR